MPRVLFLTDSLSNGGAERQLALLVKSLPEDWERRVWSLSGGPFADVIRKNGFQVDVHERSWRWDITTAFSLWQLVETWRPQIIHSYFYTSTLEVLPAAKALHIPLVNGSIREANVPRYRGRIRKWSLKWADRVIANSQAGLKAFGVEPERGRVVYNGFDTDRLNMGERVRLKKDNLFTVIMVGRMHPMKDYMTYIAAARLLIDKEDGWRFIALGNGPLRESFMNKASDLVEKGIFVFPEPTLEVLPYVAGADVGILMTKQGVHEEGFSNAIMEYMACSLPVVCSESGGNRELVVDKQTGFIIEPNNPDVLAEKLIWLRRHPDAARNIGSAGRECILREFTAKNMVERTLSVYQEVLRI